jgi:hypothetical protein
MSYMYELDEQGRYQVGFYMGASKCVDATYATAEEAAARVSYLNGGIDPALTAMAIKLLPEVFREALIDPRANLEPKCVHGKLFSEPCEQCDDPNAQPDSMRQGAGPIA